MKRNNSGKGGTRAGKVVGIMRSAGNWLFLVQAFGTDKKSAPVYCGFRQLDQLTGSHRRKAERWLAELA